MILPKDTIIGIGYDAVAIDRFKQWSSYSPTRLKRIFSADEIAYCHAEPLKSPERFAARFAVKEATYKALCQAGYKVPFLTLCSTLQVRVSPQGPLLELPYPRLTALVSITHTDTCAYAVVMLKKSSLVWHIIQKFFGKDTAKIIDKGKK